MVSFPAQPQELSTSPRPNRPTRPRPHLQIPPQPPPRKPHSPIIHHPNLPLENHSKTAFANRPLHPSKKPHRRCTGADAQDGAPEQHHDRRPQRHHLPPLRAHPGGRHLAVRARRRHRVRALPRGARHRAGGLPHARLHRRPRRRLLPRHLPPLVLPRRHVRAHSRPPRLHRLRLRRHAQGHRRGRLRPGILGVQARGLLQLAPEAGTERQELEQDQELPPGQQRLQVPRRQEGDMGAVHQERSLPHRVRLLQASDQLRLHLHQQHAVDRPPPPKSSDPDCTTWGNDAGVLCYGCQSCKAGAVATLKQNWKRIAIINIVFLVFIIIVYSIGCCAFRNNRRDHRNGGGYKQQGAYA